MHENSMRLMKMFLKGYVEREYPNKAGIKVLDIGSASSNKYCYRSLFQFPKYNYIGLDLYPYKNVDIVAISSKYPIKDNSIDIVISGQTMEHVDKLDIFISEVYRVLKPNSLCCLICPTTGKPHWGKDYWRILPDGMRFLLESVGFTVLKSERSRLGRWRDCIGVGKK